MKYQTDLLFVQSAWLISFLRNVPYLTTAVVQRLSCFQLFMTAACQAFLSFTISWSLFRLMSTESMMPSNRLVPCHLLVLPSIFPSIRVFSAPLIR